MVKEYIFYLKVCLRLSYRPAWNSANSVIGSVFVLLGSGFTVWLLTGILGNKGEQMNLWIPIVAVLVFTYPLFLALRMIFVAPFQLDQKLTAEREKLQAELDALKLKKTKGVDGSVSLFTAIEYIQKQTRFGKRKTNQEILDELVRLSVGSAIEIRGREKGPYSQTASDYDFVVNLRGHSSCTYKNHGDLRTPALVVVRQEKRPSGDDLQSRMARMLDNGIRTTVYYNPLVSMSEIKYHFDDKSS